MFNAKIISSWLIIISVISLRLFFFCVGFRVIYASALCKMCWHKKKNTDTAPYWINARTVEKLKLKHSCFSVLHAVFFLSLCAPLCCSPWALLNLETHPRVWRTCAAGPFNSRSKTRGMPSITIMLFSSRGKNLAPPACRVHTRSSLINIL